MLSYRKLAMRVLGRPLHTGGGNDSPRPASQRAAALVLTAAMLTALTAPAFAETWDIEKGDITVKAGDTEGTNKVSQGTIIDKEDTNTVITGKSDKNTVTIEAEDKDDKVEVTLKDLNIDASRGSEAAVSVTGKGDTNIELDGDNELKSGYRHAGLEHNQTVDSEGNVTSGKLTIQDKDNNGSLDATGGFRGAGIGGGEAQNGQVTITGGTITATAGSSSGRFIYGGGSGIGGGDGDNANGLNKKSDSTGGGRGSNITISGKNTIVNAEGGAEAAGIGGGRSGDADTIEITDSTVISNGHDSDNGNSGAGIGGGGFGAGGGAGGGISNITIKDADVTAGADAGGAGIGSGRASGWISYPSIFPNWKAEHPNEGVASDITISGGRVKASGGDDSAGIGGGYLGSGSDITIKDNADVTANGGKWGAGIGGGRGGDGSDISISDSNVSASGGAAGAGIGGGRGGKGENVTISGSSTVSVKHGPGATLTSGTCYGAGAGIGNGGGKDDVRGEEIAPDISGIDSTGQGYINYYDSDNNLLTRVPSAPAPEENDSEGDDAEPALSASMKQAVSQLEVRGALRQNLMQDTSIVQQDYDADAHVLTIRAELSIATLTGTLGSLKALQAQGVTTITLVTQHCTSTLDLAELTALGGEDTVFSLVHTAGIPALSVGGALHNELIH